MNKTKQNALTASPPLEALVDEKQAAQFLGVATGTPGNWRRANPPTGPAFVMVEGVIRYDPKDLRTYVNTRRRAPGTLEGE